MPRLKPRSCNYQESNNLRSGDYVFAIFSARKGRIHPDLRKNYEFARKIKNFISVKRAREKFLIAEEFHRHLTLWKKETGHLSSLTKSMAHPSYRRIIELAKDSSGVEIERLLLNELAMEPDHWFQALTEITGENPVRDTDDFDDAVNAWLEWGKKKGII